LHDKVGALLFRSDIIRRCAALREFNLWTSIEAMTDLGKLLIIFGAVILVAGVVLVLLGRTHLPVGRLPGDIVYRGKHTTVYFPLATSIIVSVVLTVLLYLFGRMRR
jgi:hypothetical protein